MRHAVAVRVGPFGFRIGSDWRAPVAALERLYAGYPQGDKAGVPDFTVRLAAARPWRRWLRPAVTIAGDWWLPGTAPLPLAQGLLAAEMGMNLQVALGCRRFLLLHASVVERDGRALVMTGESGSGKSTLAALLSTGNRKRRWRLLADEFALVEPATGLIHPFPRPISLKNQSVALFADGVPPDRLGPLLVGTPKGDVRHLVPDADAIARMDEAASPALLLFPRFGAARAVRPVGTGEVFVRLTQASTNYHALGEPGFDALLRIARGLPARAIDYADGAEALALVDMLVDELWR
ncbi:HprK-related kinase A [Sphingomonas bacterium]|uniref:HprK-related kinase A n=1 Tax=Sphingomonas bacterium TaxID=1895847 RepID=UPI00157519D1|nr:HprK-related kinase A [Sphingomonas bacterium]